MSNIKDKTYKIADEFLKGLSLVEDEVKDTLKMYENEVKRVVKERADLKDLVNAQNDKYADMVSTLNDMKNEVARTKKSLEKELEINTGLNNDLTAKLKKIDRELADAGLIRKDAETELEKQKNITMLIEDKHKAYLMREEELNSRIASVQSSENEFKKREKALADREDRITAKSIELLAREKDIKLKERQLDYELSKLKSEDI